jgi:hypothetical protein
LQTIGKKDVDARDKPGHDECGWLALFARHCHGIEQRFKPKNARDIGLLRLVLRMILFGKPVPTYPDHA